MPEIMEADVFQSGVFEDLLMELHHRVGVVHLACDGRWEHIRAVRVLVVFLHQ